MLARAAGPAAAAGPDAVADRSARSSCASARRVRASAPAFARGRCRSAGCAGTGGAPGEALAAATGARSISTRKGPSTAMRRCGTASSLPPPNQASEIRCSSSDTSSADARSGSLVRNAELAKPLQAFPGRSRPAANKTTMADEHARCVPIAAQCAVRGLSVRMAPGLRAEVSAIVGASCRCRRPSPQYRCGDSAQQPPARNDNLTARRRRVPPRCRARARPATHRVPRRCARPAGSRA